jgi:hypothetical protein
LYLLFFSFFFCRPTGHSQKVAGTTPITPFATHAHTQQMPGLKYKKCLKKRMTLR